MLEIIIILYKIRFKIIIIVIFLIYLNNINSKILIYKNHPNFINSKINIYKFSKINNNNSSNSKINSIISNYHLETISIN